MQVAQIQVKLAKHEKPSNRPKTYWKPSEEQETTFNEQILKAWNELQDKGGDKISTLVSIIRQAAEVTLEEKSQDIKSSYITKETWDKILKKKESNRKRRPARGRGTQQRNRKTGP
jgi:hypothetical protein